MKLLQSRVIKTVSLSLVLQILSIFTLSDLASAGAQLSSSHGFLQGQYVEVGIRPNGAFGSSGSPSPIPAGYHATNAPCLGFRVDRSKDGLERSLHFSKNRDSDKDCKIYFTIMNNKVHYSYETKEEED